MARPRAEDYDDKKQLILDQAAVLFSQKGFAGTSIATIAKFCNTSKALIYHYYQSKETLLFDMLQSHCSLLLATATDTIKNEGNAESKLRNLVSLFMDIYVTSRDKHVVLLNDLHWLAEDQQREIRDLERQVVRIFRDLVTDIRPDLDEKTRLALSMSIMGSLNWTYIWFKENGMLSPGAFAEIIATNFLAGLRIYDKAAV
ncbi:MAG TPA: TetR/AcrR family transcriptional regulator [Oculatellaceae cyanobacterium]